MKKLPIGLRILLCVVPLLATGAAVWLLRGVASQTITLGDGTQIRLAGVTYGKQHRFPGKPPKGASSAGMRSDSTNDTLCVWLSQVNKEGRWPNYELLAYDDAQTACVSSWTRTYGRFNPKGENIVGVQFSAFPRNGKKIHLRFRQWGPHGQELAKQGMIISNPAARSHSQWVAQPLPITQSDGDLEVTLTRLAYGAHFGGGYRQELADDVSNKAVLAAFRVQQNGASATNWQPVQVETSDGTGNSTLNRSWSHREENDESVMTYQWGLWLDQPAWKLRVEFSRASGFTDKELWSVNDIPIEKGDPQKRYMGRNNKEKPFAETSREGNGLKLFSVKRYPQQDSWAEGEFTVQTTQPLEGVRMTIVKIADDQGHELEHMNQGWGGKMYRFGIKKLGDAKTVNLTLAVHRSRYAEFTAKPGKEGKE